MTNQPIPTFPVLARPASAQLAAPHAPIAPRVAIAIRPATLDDLRFIDTLQKAHSRELGFLPRMALHGKINAGHVLIAEAESCPAPVGYLIAADRYFKRDEIGYVTQLAVVPEQRRSLVAAALLQAQFDRSAYGCRLYSCWCAQDLKAGEFWEAMGFIPIAFRTGSRRKGKGESGGAGGGPRVHIFWQKRIRPEDTTTPWWYPAQTGGGELREDRLVFPIPPGTHWRDVLPIVLPEDENAPQSDAAPQRRKKPETIKRIERRIVKRPRGPRMPGGLWFANDLIDVVEEVEVEVPVEEPEEETTALAKSKPTLDPRLTALARELRDRWSEQGAQHPTLIADATPRHDVRRLSADLPNHPLLAA